MRVGGLPARPGGAVPGRRRRRARRHPLGGRHTSTELGGNDALAVAGDSAGGNLAAVVAQELRTALAAQLLIYPATDMLGEHPSRTENGTGYFLEHRHHGVVLRALRRPRHRRRRAAVADRWPHDLAGLPPAVVVTAEYDPLRDEGEAYAAALRAAGVPVEARRFDGMIHGFFDMGSASAAARRAVSETCALLGEVLHP